MCKNWHVARRRLVKRYLLLFCRRTCRVHSQNSSAKPPVIFLLQATRPRKAITYILLNFNFRKMKKQICKQTRDVEVQKI